MGNPEDTPSGINTNTQNENSSKSDKSQSNTFLGQRRRR